VTTPKRPPRDNLYRAYIPGVEFRDTETADSRPRLTGHFARFGEWNEIDSIWEGRFLERVEKGAYTRSFKNKGDKMPVLFQHGQDPEIGDKVIAAHELYRDDDFGPYYEARLLDGLPPLVVSGLKEGRYGASYRFRVLKEEVNLNPKKSAHNPEGIPERTIQEAEVFEYGPVTFPADSFATAGVRSLTDAYMTPEILRSLLEDPDKVRQLLAARPELARNDPALASAIEDALPDDGPDASHSDEGTRAEEPPAPPADPPAEVPATIQDPPAGGSLSVREIPKMNLEELRSRQDEIQARFQEIHAEHGVNKLPDDVKTEWDALVEERTDIEARITEYEERSALLRSLADKPQNVEKPIVTTRTSASASRVPQNIYAIEEYRNLSRSDDEMVQAFRDGAMKSLEGAVFAHERANDNESKAHIERLLAKDKDGVLARHLLATGSPVYARAFGKLLSGKPVSAEEARAIATVGSSQLADGGYAVPYTLDPTLILTSDGQINPLRSMARVETLTTGNTWKGVTTAGISVSRVAEETAVDPTTPVLAQPSVTVQAVKAEIQFSIEADEDWPRLQAEMARLFQDAKDAEEAEQFINGNGNGTTGNPEGVVAGLASTSDVGTTGDGFDIEDVHRLINALPDRFEPRAQFLGHRAVYSAIAQFGNVANAGAGAVWQTMGQGRPAQLLGYPARYSSAMESDYTTTGNDILLFGDFSAGFIIVDKVGLTVEIDPHVRNGDGKWTGQRALLMHYRNNSMVLVDNALRILKVGVVTS
jgi:HK97 family phage major capsid protein